MAVKQRHGQRKSRDDIVVMDEESAWHTTIDPQEGIRWSRHALGRYYERTPSNAVTHDTAWRNGIHAQFALPYFRSTETNRFPQTVRLYDHKDRTVSVMVVRNDTVVTTLTVDGISDSAVRAYCYALTNLHNGGKLVNHTSLYGESPTRIEQVNRRE